MTDTTTCSDPEVRERAHVPFSYLDRQFDDLEPYLADIAALVRTGDFTLGQPLVDFEQRFAELCRVPFAVGVGSGTDALMLSLKALGIGPGDEVITTPTTFVATVGAIVMTGARPVFVDSDEGLVIDATQIEGAITSRTRAIVPVHYTGQVADMPAIMEIAQCNDLYVVEDACQAIGGAINGTPAGSWGHAAAFSLHPLKNIHVWGDGGMIVTHEEYLADQLRLLRNHGMVNRDEVALFAGNCRLDTLQAVVGNRMLEQFDFITNQRMTIAKRYDRALANLGPPIRVPKRRPGVRHVFHLYVVRAERRDALLAFLQDRGVEAKVHYPIPLHLQEAARYLGYKEGDFPVAEADAHCMITLPAHQHLTDDEIDYTIEQIHTFYER